MPSLVKKMFDTMPLKGVLGAAGRIVGAATPPTLGQLKRFIKVYRTPPTHTVDPISPSAGSSADGAEIWGWTTAGDPSQVTQVTCRVRDMSFAKQLVLERLDFGYAKTTDAKTFLKKVLVVFNGKDVELPLSAQNALVSFTTRGGYILPNKNAELWPLESYQDESLLHVFAYDVDRVTLAIQPLNDAKHPDKAKVDAMLARLDELTTVAADDTRIAGDVLFADDLWDPSPANTPPTGTVPEDVNLSLKAVRILVACSMTTCRERDDYQPGKLGGVGRLYPHILVVSTFALDRVDAAVHFKRPTKTATLDGGFSAADPHAAHNMTGANEMLPTLKSLLIADSNKGGMVLSNVPFIDGPLPYWASMFNYYVVDPLKDPAVGDKLIPLVRRSKTLVRNQITFVTRDCSDIRFIEGSPFNSSNRSRVLKREDQGYFDNIHVACRMVVKDAIAKVEISNLTGLNTTVSADTAAWKMDEVTMAPFCAHDCFHMHWRWSDNLNNEQATYGWGPVKPHDEVGRGMIPRNQDAYLQLLADAEYSYLAQAFNAPKDAWQPFCHHGAGYALHVGELMEKARAKAPGADHMRFYDAAGKEIDPTGWALFYWRLRYRLVGSGKSYAGRYLSVNLEERFSFSSKGTEHDVLEI